MTAAKLSPVDAVIDQVPGFVVGILTGLLTGVPAGLLVDRIAERRKRRDQVRQVTASITLTWAPVPGQSNTKVMTGGYLSVKNNSEWPVRDVIVMEPDWLNKLDVPYLGPGSEHVELIPSEALHAHRGVNSLVTLQVSDVRGRRYQWRPVTDELFDPRWIPLHARLIQSMDRRSGGRLVTPLLRHLPKKVADRLWGYDPSGERSPTHPRMRPLV